MLVAEDDSNDAFILQRVFKQNGLTRPVHVVPDGADKSRTEGVREQPSSSSSQSLAFSIARKLTVAIWYLMNGRWTPLGEIDKRLSIKVGKIITNVGTAALRSLGGTRQQLRA